jgi:hypothetical protein
MPKEAANEVTPEDFGFGAFDHHPTAPQQRVKGFKARVFHLLQRAGLATAMGAQFGGARDIYESFGWDKAIGLQQIWEMYVRGGVSKRIVEAKPAACWGRPPRIYHPDDPEWGQSFAELAWEFDLWSNLRRADILAGLGRYSILLIGTNRGSLDRPIPRGGAGDLKITYLQPYGETQCIIKDFDKDPMSPRFSLPTMYTIQPQVQSQVRTTDSSGTTAPNTMPHGSSFDVHWSRVIHLSKGGLQNSVFGIPDYAPIWNYLTDLMKVVGASSESYWMNAYPGLHMDVDPDMDLDEEDEANLSAEMDEYQHSYRRYIRSRGVTIKNIGSKVADPKGSFDVLMNLISGTTGIPKRILMGSEAGQLASTQDKGNWAERIEEYREEHAEPDVLWPFVMWVINNGILPLPGSADVRKLRALWPDAYRMSPLERGQQAAQTARSLANLAKGMEPIVTKKGTPGTPDTTNPETGEVIPGTPATPDETTDALISRDEARKIIGLSTDQAAFIETPEENA